MLLVLRCSGELPSRRTDDEVLSTRYDSRYVNLRASYVRLVLSVLVWLAFFLLAVPALLQGYGTVAAEANYGERVGARSSPCRPSATATSSH